MTTIQLLTILAPLAFIVGFALQRGNVCSVLAARQIVWCGRWSRLRGLLLASAWGFVLLMPIALFGIEPFTLSRQASPSVFTVLAGALYACGCYLTGACIFGICSRTTAGHISFVFAIPAMAVGATLGQQSGISPQTAMMGPSPVTAFNPPLLLLWLLIAAWLIWTSRRVFKALGRAGVTPTSLLNQPRWRSSFAAMIIGLLGAGLFATDTAWFYPAAAKRVALYIAGLGTTIPLDSLIGGGALFLGGFAAGLLKGRFLLRPPHLIPSLQAIAGGLVIGYAWAMIPGGNDAMVLYLLPSLALNGIVAYIAMFVTLIAIEYLKRRLQPMPAPVEPTNASAP